MAPGNRSTPRRASSSDSTHSLTEFMRRFPDDEACLVWLWTQRLSPDGRHAHCPRCELTRTFRRHTGTQKRQSWTCTNCGHHLHPTAGTIFHSSSTSLRLWFYAVYLMSATRCGISAKQLERELGVTYKTAWRMFHLIRNRLMSEDSGPLSGEVEMDETYVGGRPRKGQVTSKQEARAWSERKVKVFGMVERQGKVSAHVVPDVASETLMAHVRPRVLPATMVYTDEAPRYTRAVPRAGYQHRRIHHTAKVYVDGAVHTQTIEGFWSLVKRGISGTHHAVSARYLQGYLDEYAWRWNHRYEPMFDLLLLRAAHA